MNPQSSAGWLCWCWPADFYFPICFQLLESVFTGASSVTPSGRRRGHDPNQCRPGTNTQIWEDQLKISQGGPLACFFLPFLKGGRWIGSGQLPNVTGSLLGATLWHLWQNSWKILGSAVGTIGESTTPSSGGAAALQLANTSFKKKRNCRNRSNNCIFCWSIRVLWWSSIIITQDYPGDSLTRVYRFSFLNICTQEGFWTLMNYSAPCSPYQSGQ